MTNPDEITLTLPLAMVNQCLEALAEQPIKAALPAFTLIRDQARTQVEARKAETDASA